jgi:hypothetical protein
MNTHVINKNHSLVAGIWWSILLVTTFQFRYYEFYFPKNEIIYRDLKSIMACSGFSIPGFGSDCSVWIYGKFF